MPGHTSLRLRPTPQHPGPQDLLVARYGTRTRFPQPRG